MTTTPNTALIITAACFFLLLAVFWLCAELSVSGLSPEARLREYLPQIFGLWFEGIVIVVIIGWWQYRQGRSRRQRLLKVITKELTLMGDVMTNFIRNSHPIAINCSTYKTIYTGMRVSLAGLTSQQVQDVANAVLVPAERHWNQLRMLTNVVVVLGDDNLGAWLGITNKLYNITLYARDTNQGNNPQTRNGKAEAAYRECAALFCQLHRMGIPR